MARAGDKAPGASHMPPAVVTRTRLDKRGLVKDARSEAMVDNERARAFTRLPRSAQRRCPSSKALPNLPSATDSPPSTGQPDSPGALHPKTSGKSSPPDLARSK